MTYGGVTHDVRVRFIAESGHWAEYRGQECDARFYESLPNVQINSEQLLPPIPKYQSVPKADLLILPAPQRPRK